MTEEIINIWDEIPDDWYPEFKIYTANQWEDENNDKLKNKK